MPKEFPAEYHRYGLRRALWRLSKRRHLLPAAAWLMLAAFVALGFAQERIHSNQNRQQATAITKNVLIHSCRDSKGLRYTLREILGDEYSTIAENLRNHLITAQQAIEANQHITTDINRIIIPNCQQLYSGIK